MIRKLLARGKAAWAVVPDGKTELLIQRRPKKLYAGANGQPIARRAAPNPSCPRDYVAEFVEYLKSAEKFIPHMYLDTTEKRFGPEDSTGNVTVGIGHYLADIGMVMETRNRFYLPQAAIDAGRTLDEVLAEDFNRLFGQNSRGRVADDYAALTTARMSESEALGMLREDVDKVIDAATPTFKAFGTFPCGAKLAILDLMFTGGVNIFEDDWPKFQEAVRNRDWRRAATESHRKTEQVGEERNAPVRQWLLNALHEERFWINPGRR